MIVKEIKIADEDINRLERAYFEYTASRDTIAYILETHANDKNYVKTASFESYENAQIEKLKVYDYIRDEIVLKYLPEEFVGDSKFMWRIDFPNKKMIVEGE